MTTPRRSTNATPDSNPPVVRRPFLLRITADIFLILSLIGWVRVVQGLANWKLQVDLLGRPVAIYLILGGALWGVVGLLAGLALWRRSEWAIPAAWVGAIFFPLAYWLERFILVRSPVNWINWPFMAGLSLLWLLLVSITLTLRSCLAYLAREKPSE